MPDPSAPSYPEESSDPNYILVESLGTNGVAKRVPYSPESNVDTLAIGEVPANGEPDDKDPVGKPNDEVVAGEEQVEKIDEDKYAKMKEYYAKIREESANKSTQGAENSIPGTLDTTQGATQD